MKIKIALISSEHISDAQALSVKLHSAMEAGDMRTVDQVTEKLLSLTDKDYSLSLSEEYWHKLLEQERSFKANFKSEYLITKPQLEMIIATGVGDSFADVAIVVEQALMTDGVVLQLPFEEEDKNV